MLNLKWIIGDVLHINVVYKNFANSDSPTKCQKCSSMDPIETVYADLSHGNITLKLFKAFFSNNIIKFLTVKQ
jgi:hypothetical protein